MEGLRLTPLHRWLDKHDIIRFLFVLLLGFVVFGINDLIPENPGVAIMGMGLVMWIALSRVIWIHEGKKK